VRHGASVERVVVLRAHADVRFSQPAVSHTGTDSHSRLLCFSDAASSEASSTGDFKEEP